MAGVKGRSGKPKGKPWGDALRMEIAAAGEDNPRALRSIAQKALHLAATRDTQGIKEIGDRLDGKPAQESTVIVDDKRDATDWTRDELVAFLDDAKAGSNGAAKANGSHREPDSVH